MNTDEIIEHIQNSFKWFLFINKSTQISSFFDISKHFHQNVIKTIPKKEDSSYFT